MAARPRQRDYTGLQCKCGKKWKAQAIGKTHKDHKKQLSKV